ncbi:hypothetical protein HME9304_01951 [Flagellimonas maritima]|uniref:Uncharacterized protein n=1 Tax=Flagellimonas maritima TaxID=1383885 RepID=A0A2Z4LSR7_9FLAO|nr:hypothetical protein [Allomuricauda aurantiaca]AWX44945.1 hypothetical protein HME9304_01951 [Allomuricauda aurantiaca]
MYVIHKVFKMFPQVTLKTPFKKRIKPQQKAKNQKQLFRDAVAEASKDLSISMGYRSTKSKLL